MKQPKRICAALLCLCMMLTSLSGMVFAAEGEGSVSAAVDADGKVTISIDTGIPAQNWVSVLVMHPRFSPEQAGADNLSAAVNYMNEVQTDAEGMVAPPLSYPLKSDAPSGKYQVYVTVNAETPFDLSAASFTYRNPTDIVRAIAAVNTATDGETLKNKVEEQKALLGMDTRIWNQLSEEQKTGMCDAMYAQSPQYADGDAFDAVFYPEVMLAGLKALADKGPLVQTLKEYPTELGIAASAAAVFAGLSGTAQTDAVTQMQAKPLSRDTLADAFYDAAICAGVAAASNWTIVRDVVEGNKALLSLDQTYFASLRDTSAVYKSLLGSPISTRKELESLFAAAAQKQYQTEHSVGTVGGGGSTLTRPSAVAENNLTTPPEIEQEALFEDLIDVPWAIDSIHALAAMGAVSGRGDKVFDPEAEITREEFVKILAAAFAMPIGQASCDFTDVDAAEYYYPYVAAAAELGLVQGREDRTFGVGENISREDMAVLIYRFSRRANLRFEIGEGAIFTDEADISDYALEAVRAMENAGILNGTGGGAFEPRATATRAEAAKAIYATLAYGKLIAGSSLSGVQVQPITSMRTNASKEAVLAGLGLIPEGSAADSTEYYETDIMVSALRELTDSNYYDLTPILEFEKVGITLGYITYGQALKTMVDLLGYTAQANDGGGYPSGYSRIASQIGLTDGISASPDKVITKAEFIHLLYNALDIDVQTVYGYQNDAQTLLSITNGETILGVYRKIYMLEGIVTENEVTSLSSAGGTGKDSGRVRVAGELIEVGDTNLADFLGYSVKVYYQKEDAKSTALACMQADGNNVVSVAYKNIESCSDTQFTYYDTADRLRTINMKPSIDVIYNGVALQNFDAALFTPKLGEVTFIDNNDDNSYDVVCICEYADMVVQSVDVRGLRVYDKYDGSKLLKLNEFDSYCIKEDNHALELNQLKAGDILSVACSKDKKYVELLRSKATAVGVVDKKITGDPTYVSIGDALYEVDDRLIGSVTDPGKQIFGYLDVYGRIVEIDEVSGEVSYGYIFNTALETTAFGGVIKLRMLNAEGEVISPDVASRVLIDGVRYDDAATAYAALQQEDGEIPAQLVEYTLNEKGVVTKLDRAYAYRAGETPIRNELALGQDEDENSLNKFYIGKNTAAQYRSAQRNLFGKCALASNAIVFFVPSNTKQAEIKEDEIAIGTPGTLLNATSYKADGYRTSRDTLEASILVVYDVTPNTTSLSKSFFVVSGVQTAVKGENAIAYTEVVGYESGGAASFYLEDELIPSGGFHPGDVLRVNKNASGKAMSVTRLVSQENGERKLGFTNPSGAYSHSDRVSYGAVVERQGDIIQVELGDGSITGGTRESVNTNNFTVYVVDLDEPNEADRVRTGTRDELMDYMHYGNEYSTVLIRMSSSRACDMVIFK